MNRWAWLGLLLAAGAALALRCPDLGLRPMHNDEAVNAVKFGQLWEHGGYKYDPEAYHGPTLYYATAALSRLTGAPAFSLFTEARLRMVTVVFGVGILLLLPLVADALGTDGTVWAAFLMAASPAMVFYSRYYIHEIPLVFFSFLAIAAGYRYSRSRRLGWAMLAGGAVGLMDATKETFVLSVAAAALAVVLDLAWSRLLDASTEPARPRRILTGHLAAAAVMWVAVAAVLFSSFLTDAAGPLDSLRAYAPWVKRASADAAHVHPWYFYLHRLLFFRPAEGPIWSEALIFVLAGIGAAGGFVRKGLGEADASFVRFLGLYTIVLAGCYSVLAYKTPWCLLNFWLGMILLAGVGAAMLVRLARGRFVCAAPTVLLAAAVGQLAVQAWRGSHEYAADGRNPYVYAQTVPDILNLVRLVETLAEASPQGHHTEIKVMAPDSDFWPLPWYLRNFNQVRWYSEVPPDPFAPIMVVSTAFQAGLDEKKTHLMPQIFELRPQVFFELYVESNLWRAHLANASVTRTSSLP